MAERLFEDELAGWCTDETHWPMDRTKELFWQWFGVEVHSEVFDAVKGAIKRELG